MLLKDVTRGEGEKQNISKRSPLTIFKQNTAFSDVVLARLKTIAERLNVEETLGHGVHVT